MTGLFKVANTEEGWIAPPEKAGDIPLISFKVESAVLKKYYYSKNRCPKFWEETEKAWCSWPHSLKVNIVTFCVYRSEAATMGIKLHDKQSWQINELLCIYAGS